MRALSAHERPQLRQAVAGRPAGQHRSEFNENSEGLYLTSSFVHESAAMAAERFANRAPGNVYSRFTNPTVTVFEQRLAALEGAECCIATSSGMAAILCSDDLEIAGKFPVGDGATELALFPFAC